MELVKSFLTSKKYAGFRAFMYLIPALIVIVTFRFIPIVISLITSFYADGVRGVGYFIGFTNYAKLFTDISFWKSLVWTMWFTVGVVPAGVAISLFFAVLLKKGVKALGIYRTAYFIPVVTSTVAVSMVWKWMFNYKIVNF